MSEHKKNTSATSNSLSWVGLRFCSDILGSKCSQKIRGCSRRMSACERRPQSTQVARSLEQKGLTRGQKPRPGSDDSSDCAVWLQTSTFFLGVGGVYEALSPINLASNSRAPDSKIKRFKSPKSTKIKHIKITKPLQHSLETPVPVATRN